jgi:hypothetical protein
MIGRVLFAIIAFILITLFTKSIILGIIGAIIILVA